MVITISLYFYWSIYSCFTMLCYFLMYSKVNQPFKFFLEFPSHLGHQIALSRVPCAVQ